MTVNGKKLQFEGTIHAGPNTRKNNGLVLEAIFKGPRNSFYSVSHFEDGRTLLYRRGRECWAHQLMAFDPKIEA